MPRPRPPGRGVLRRNWAGSVASLHELRRCGIVRAMDVKRRFVGHGRRLLADGHRACYGRRTSAFVASGDPVARGSAALARLPDPLLRRNPCSGMRVKFCGVTNLEDAREAARLGAWAIGLNHHPESPRFCEPAVAAEIAASVQAPARDRRGVREPDPGQLAARGRGRVADAWSSSTATRGPRSAGRRPAHGLQGDQGAAGAKRRRHPGAPRPTAPTSTCSTPTGRGRPAAPVRASTGSCSPAAAPRCR